MGKTEAAPLTFGQIVWKGLSVIASLRLTVTLFWLAFILVFLGTVAMKDEGIWTIVTKCFRTHVAWIPYQTFVRFGQVFFGIWQGVNWAGSFPYPGGWTLGALLMTNLLAAHFVRFRVTYPKTLPSFASAWLQGQPSPLARLGTHVTVFLWANAKRSGIILLHAGVIVMFVGEWLTGTFAVEGHMAIEEGRSSNYLVHNRFTEFAVVDPSDPKEEQVVVVPERFLKRGGTVRHESLPFDIEVKKYMVNSEIIRVERDKVRLPNPATDGAGLEWIAREQPEISGVATNEGVDVPSIYATLKHKKDGTVLGTYLFSLNLELHQQPPQLVTVDGKTYETALRFKRTYKPYTVYLKEFRFDRYEGTETPKNFSSLVRLVDHERNETREDVLIRMNDPMWHRNETFFQASFDKKTEKATVLQVVENPGWLMPYLSCGMVAGGMLIHFGIGLFGFLRLRFAL